MFVTNWTRLFDRSFAYSGRELRRLMRSHKVTIRAFAARSGLPLCLIRDRLRTGVCGYAALDWHEHITGSLTPRMKAALRQRMRST